MVITGLGNMTTAYERMLHLADKENVRNEAKHKLTCETNRRKRKKKRK